VKLAPPSVSPRKQIASNYLNNHLKRSDSVKAAGSLYLLHSAPREAITFNEEWKALNFSSGIYWVDDIISKVEKSISCCEAKGSSPELPLK